MALGTGYSYSQRGDVVLTNRTGTTRNIHTNTEAFIAFKGVETRIAFFLKDEQGKPIQLHDKTVVASAVKRNTNTVGFTRSLIVKDYSSGIAELHIKASDIYSLDEGQYSLVLTYTDLNNTAQVIYTNKNNNIDFLLNIENNVIPDSIDALEVSVFNPTPETGDNVEISNVLAGSAQSNNLSGQNSIAVYTTAATGTLIIEATLETSTSETDWFTVGATITLTAVDGVSGYTFEGNYLWVRFSKDISEGTLDKIALLY